ncbi:DUF111 family protein [Clostridium tyrobutyricum]|nr:DUF111 family protein [Clostridium tyrobutyricum]MBV4425286.1 DUF111 family protein [Clostridium tyrobutyricum]MBV4428446.1 DUF111 family protein [Clostridium tyrobutyricum]MBV4438769.1 DUF111 family protein [Clostridium tyrobutyricum]MBV4442590.1 DUF111 family protein [Clostridium tyrobutyricum]
MKILYCDCFCGISGDMNLAALIDLGVPEEYLIEELLKLNLNSEYEIKIESSMKLGITGIRVDVILKDKLEDNTHISEQTLYEHSREGHVHNHKHHHRNLKDVEKIINLSNLSDRVKKLSLDIFMKVAEAEAKIHGKGLYEVHFHEVGALDVFKTPILMKKGRPGIELSVLTNEKVEKNVLDVIFEETTS